MQARAYELMIIVDTDEDDHMVDDIVKRVSTWFTDGGGVIASVDKWGKKKFAYEINHKTDGHYVVLEMVGEGRDLDPMERMLRVADEVVRHKVIRLPEHEALRRGLVTEDGEPAPPKPASSSKGSSTEETVSAASNTEDDKGSEPAAAPEPAASDAAPAADDASAETPSADDSAPAEG